MGRHEILATWVVLTILLIYWFLGVALRIFKLVFPKRESKFNIPCKNRTIKQNTPNFQKITDNDLRKLVQQLDEGDAGEHPWEYVLDKSGQGVSYSAKRRESKNGGPTEYLSTTVFQNCTPDLLRDFYMDNEFRMDWDKTVVQHRQLDICSETGTEVGQTIKKFPLMTPREYVLAWRLWEDENKSAFYCVIKACQHERAPKQQKFMRVEEYFSAWRIQQVPGSSNACEVKMFHSENIGMRREMAKMAFSRGIWSFVCKMESNLRKYTPQKNATGPNALTLCHKAPLDLCGKDNSSLQGKNHDQITVNVVRTGATTSEKNAKDRSRPISLFAQSVFLLGWAVFLGHGGTSLGGKLAAAVFMNKATRRKQRSTSSSSRYVPKSFSVNHAVVAAAAASATARRQMKLE